MEKPNIEEMKVKKDVPGLIEALNHTDWIVRSSAACALGDIANPRAVDSLIAALRDRNSQVRFSASIALGGISDPRAVELLIVALKDENPRVREGAADALGQIDKGLEDAVLRADIVEALTAVLDYPFHSTWRHPDGFDQDTQPVSDAAKKALWLIKDRP
jgi:HEAT repeat protein